jgi:teichuronic acid biosynthesis glycosyltransferase TuaH
MEKQYDIICFSISRIDAPISSPGFSLAKEFAKTHRVFYIEHPHSWKDVIMEWNTPAIQKRRKSWFGKVSRFNQVLPNLTIVTAPITFPINFLPEGKLYNRLSAWNDELLFRTIRKLKQQHQINEYFFINFFDPFFCRQFPADIRPKKFIYQSMDAIGEVAYTARHGVRLENEMIEKADATICTSTGLVEQHKHKSSKVFLLPNGVDESIFSSAPSKPAEELRDVKKPVIGYTGSIEYRMDFELLLAVVKLMPSYLFCFVGPVYEKGAHFDELRNFPNVRFLGPRPLRDLPGYLHYFDVAIIPFKCNSLTSKIYPLKINEYLMAGKPVVSTNFSLDISSFVPHIYIASNPAEFAMQLNKAIQENDGGRAGARIAIARQNSWQERARHFFEIITALD